jgi:16S rRNA (uracil1498-N3)-methyltransferase
VELPRLPANRVKPRRFLIRHPVAPEATVEVTGELFHHMATVLRLKQGTAVVLVDEEGAEYLSSIEIVERERVVLRVGPVRSPLCPETVRLILYQGLPRGDKMDLIVQKATELGVFRIVPVLCARSVARPEEKRRETKVSRWNKIAEEAARQCERGAPPAVSDIVSYREAVSEPQAGAKLILWEEERNRGLKEVLPLLECPREITLLVGPEGGLTAEEASLAKENGFLAAGLGPRILRTETASIAALAVMQFWFGDLG